MIDEGYIKYQCNWIRDAAINPEKLLEINQWRSKLYQLGLIGEYPNKIGFGNISIRGEKSGEFIISGTHTGGISCLTEAHYTIVNDFDWEKNYVTCVGPIQSSSEALTHAAIYVANSEVNAVIHVHHFQLWQCLLNVVPTTDKNCAYGTPEMAREIMRISQGLGKEKKIVVMAGHEEGIITFGKNLDEAGRILLAYYDGLMGN